MLRGPLLMLLSVLLSGFVSAIVANVSIHWLGMNEEHAMGVLTITAMATFLSLALLIYRLGYY